MTDPMSGALAALRGFRRRWAEPESGPEVALEAACAPSRPTVLRVATAPFALLTMRAPLQVRLPLLVFCLLLSKCVRMSVRQQLGQSVLHRPPLRGREWAPQRVDGRGQLAVEPCHRAALQYRPLLAPSFVSRFSPLAQVASLESGFTVVTSASKHSANWKKVLGIWSELVSRHASCSEHFAGALRSEYKEVFLSQMLS